MAKETFKMGSFTQSSQGRPHHPSPWMKQVPHFWAYQSTYCMWRRREKKYHWMMIYDGLMLFYGFILHTPFSLIGCFAKDKTMGNPQNYWSHVQGEGMCSALTLHLWDIQARMWSPQGVRSSVHPHTAYNSQDNAVLVSEAAPTV